jgi:HD-like signal output (HDOD) protein
MSITEESILEDLRNDRLPLPTLPEVAIKVRETVDDDNSTIKDISEIIETDAALSARIIQVANSALYRGLNTSDSVHNAVTRMGLITVRNLATSLVMRQLFQATNPVVDKYLRKTWKLSTDVAALSAMLAKTSTHLDPNSALLAGLTHCIGVSPILVKAESDPELLNNINMLDQIINELYPVVGASILRKWDFHDEMIMVPAQHLDIHRVNDGAADFTDVVQVALIETVAGTSHPLGNVDTSQVGAFARVGLDSFEEIDMSGGVAEIKEAIA